MNSPCLCTTLRQAALATTAIYDARLAPSGLKVTMFRLLRQIAQAREITIMDLAGRVGLDRSTLGRNLRVLQRQGLITLSVGTDKRARLAALTKTGQDALTRAEPLWQSAQHQLKAQVGTDLDMLMASLRHIAAQGTPAEGGTDAL